MPQRPLTRTRNRQGSHPELVHVRLADDDGACGLQCRDRLGVPRRNPIGELLKRGGRPNAGRVVEVFHGNGNPVQRTAPLSGVAFRLSRSRLFARGVGQHGDERIQPRIQCLDAREAFVHEFNSRQFPRPQQRGGITDAEMMGL